MTKPVAAMLKAFPGLRLQTCTDKEGRYELGLPTSLGEVIVVARPSSFVVARSARIELGLGTAIAGAIELPPKYALRARVVDDNLAPVADASVIVRGTDIADTLAHDGSHEARIKTNSAGLFLFYGLGAGEYAVEISRGPQFIPRKVDSVKFSATEWPIPRIEIYRAQYISGAVISTSGKAVSNALLIGRDVAGHEIETASRMDGTFSLGPFARGTNVYLTTTAEGFGQARSDGFVPPLTDVQILLSPNGALRGKVVDAADGKPIRQFEISFARRPHVPRSSPFPGTRAFKTSDGTFNWPSIESKVWSFTVTATGYEPLDVDGVSIRPSAITDELLLSLRPGQELKGRVTDKLTGRPINGARVTFENRFPTISERLMIPPRASITTDEHGEFLLTGLPRGKGEIEISATGYPAYRQKLEPESEPNVEIALRKGVTVSGILMFADGVTPASGMVRLSELDSGVEGALPADKEGKFEFRDVNPGAFLIAGWSDAGRTQVRRIDVSEARDLTDLRLVIQDGRAIHGKVTGLLPGERDVVDVEIASAGRLIEKTQTDASGTYVVSGLAPGAFDVEAVTSLDRHLRQPVVVSRDLDANVDFAFPSGFRLHGRVTRSGKPVPFVTLEATPIDNAPFTASGESSQSGQYTIEGLPPGEYRVRAEGRNTAMTVGVLNDARLDFALPEFKVVGHITRLDTSEPLAGAQLVLSERSLKAGRQFQTSAVSEYNGQFSLTDLNAGQFQLSVYKADFEIFTQLISVDESATAIDIALIPTEGAEIRVADARTGKPLRHVVLADSADSGTGLLLEIALIGGIGRVPKALTGHSLLLSSFGYAPALIADWSGSGVEVQLNPVTP